MGFEFPLSKAMTDVYNSVARAEGPGSHLGTLPVLLGPRVLSVLAQFLVPWRTCATLPPLYWFRHCKFRGYPKIISHCTLLPLRRRGEGKEGEEGEERGERWGGMERRREKER